MGHMKKQTITINPGITINIETQTVTLDSFALDAWPWSGKKWPCKIETEPGERITFTFEDGGDYVVPQLVDITTKVIERDMFAGDMMSSAMATDCANLLHAVEHGCAFAMRVLFADSWHRAIENAKEAGHRAGDDSAHWIAQDTFGGRTRDRDIVANAKRFLAMDEEGDPALYDNLPMSPLSGEYAGDPLAQDAVMDALELSGDALDVMRDQVTALDMEDSFQALQEQICSTYEDSHNERMLSRLVEIARGIVDNDNEQKAKQ